jgi:hypothetical protein
MKRGILAAVLALAPAAAFGAAASNGAPTLRRPLSARAAGLGEAFAAVDGGTDSLGTNPAGAAAAKRPELLATFTSGVGDDAFGFFGYAHPTKAGVALAGLTYYDAGTFNAVDVNGAQTTVVAERDYVGTFGWAVPIGGGLSVGALGKAYHFTLAQSASANGFAGDAGARWATPVRGLSLGVALQNLGPGVKFESASDPLPLTARGGAAWTIEALTAPGELTYYHGTRFMLVADAVKVRNEAAGGAGGAEFTLDMGDATEITLRGSYVFSSGNGGPSFGVGLREGRFVGDYALLAKRDLGSVHNISLGVRF